MGFPYHTPVPKVTTVDALTTDQLFLPENSNRRGFSVYNDSSAVLYLKWGEQASSTSFTVKLGAGDFYESPYGYSGPLYGVWVTATGTALITEVL